MEILRIMYKCAKYLLKEASLITFVLYAQVPRFEVDNPTAKFMCLTRYEHPSF